MYYSSMSKKALAQAAGVSSSTLRRWLQQPCIQNQLDDWHISRHRHIFPPKAVQLICEHYAIDIN